MTPPAFLKAPRILWFGGKGGVGKTTCACATALARARVARNVRLISLDPAHSVRDALADLALPENLRVEEWEASRQLADFLQAHRSKFLEMGRRGTFFDEDDLESLLDLQPPGMDEVMALLNLAREIPRDPGTDFILDTAPTGHALALLRTPEIVQVWIRALDGLLAKHRYMLQQFKGSYDQDALDLFLEDLHQQVEDFTSLLGDDKALRFIPVLRPERLVLAETLDLCQSLNELGLPPKEALLNLATLEDFRLILPEGLDLESFMHRSNLTSQGLRVLPAMAKECTGEDLEHLFDQSRSLDELELAYRSSRKAPQVSRPLALPATSIFCFCGKGGVGKTTLASAAALALAKIYTGEGLLFSADPAHSLSDVWDQPIGSSGSLLAPGLFAVEVEAAASWEELRGLYAHELEHSLSKGLKNLDLAFDREVLENLLELTPPGLHELMALIRLLDLVEERDPAFIVLDPAPTGHFLRFLSTPQLLDDWLKQLFDLILKYREFLKLPKLSARLVKVSRRLKGLRKRLQAPEEATFVLVAHSNRVVMAETEDLLEGLRRQSLPVSGIFYNRIPPSFETAPLKAFAENASLAWGTLREANTGWQGVDELENLAEAAFRLKPPASG
jgi:arsenite/tail-anchored protein-transporting ATPase